MKIQQMIHNGTKLKNYKGQQAQYHDKNVLVVILEKFFQVINIKHNKEYTVLSAEVINCTNSANNSTMVLYTDGNKLFVREIDEFNTKCKTVVDIIE